MKHPTTTIAVRAPVDNFIVPVVRALMTFPEVATLYSCQGECISYSEWHWDKNSAYVIFLVGKGTAVEEAVFLDFLAERAGNLPLRLQLEMAMVSGVPQIEMRMRQEDIEKVAQWLGMIRGDWQGLSKELSLRLAKI